MEPLLNEQQRKAISQMKNGSILRAETGLGKTRTSLGYFFTRYGGNLGEEFGYEGRFKMPSYLPNLYVITTAKTRDSKSWERELNVYRLYDNDDFHYVVDSWNNIDKYRDVKDSFFIFDEQRAGGSGKWAKRFIEIAQNNEWVLLSATPGDKWKEYIPIFIAHGFYRNKTDFMNKHCLTNPYRVWDIKYINEGMLIRHRRDITVYMDKEKPANPNHHNIYAGYDKDKYTLIQRDRWNPYSNEPIQNGADLVRLLRRVVNEDYSRIELVAQILLDHPKLIIFYNFNYERDLLRMFAHSVGIDIAEWNGSLHQNIPSSDSWIYIVQYSAGCEGWNCFETDTMVFYSQDYSYKRMHQAEGRISRLNTPYDNVFYYHILSRSTIDRMISRSLSEKKDFNDSKFLNSIGY